VYKIFVRKPSGKRPLWRPKHRWGITMELKETGFEDVDWIHLTQDRDQ